MKKTTKSACFVRFSCEDEYAECVFDDEVMISKNRSTNWIGTLLCNIIQRQTKKLKNKKRRDSAPYSSTPLSFGEDDSIFTSSTVDTVASTSSDEGAWPLMGIKTKMEYNANPFAKQSKSIRKSKMKMKIIGDNDIWEERTLVNTKTGRQRSFFYSVNTGFRLKDEPPTGASQIVYID